MINTNRDTDNFISSYSNYTYFRMFFTCMNRDGKIKTISSHCSLVRNIEKNLASLEEKAAAEDFDVMAVTVLLSNTDFKSEWDDIFADTTVAWKNKTAELLRRCPTILVDVLYRRPGFSLGDVRSFR